MVIQTSELIPFIPNNLLFSCHKFVDVYIINTYWELYSIDSEEQKPCILSLGTSEKMRESGSREAEAMHTFSVITYGFSVLDLNMLLPSLGVERRVKKP